VPVVASPVIESPASTASGKRSENDLPGLTVVVPCYNEALGLRQLLTRLHALHDDLADAKEFHVILVDDGSVDDTWQTMTELTAGISWISQLRHECNQGITAATMTGLRAAATTWVATLDSDCTYDPLQMRQLLAAIDDQVTIVTASPYHPAGSVQGVPRWRLLLSKAASIGYATVINVNLHTYTSCFRIYRREAVIDLPVTNQGFVGMAELLWLAVRAGGTVKEMPAILTSRRIGYSKLRTMPVIVGHLRLMRRIVFQRLSSPKRPAA